MGWLDKKFKAARRTMGRNLQRGRKNVVKAAKEAKGKINEAGNNFEDSFKQHMGRQPLEMDIKTAPPAGSASAAATAFDATTVKEDKYTADGALAMGSRSTLRIKRKKKKKPDDVTEGIDAGISGGEVINLKIKPGGINT